MIARESRRELGQEGRRGGKRHRAIRELPYVAFAETYSQPVWLGMKHAKQGGVETRAEADAHGEQMVESLECK